MINPKKIKILPICFFKNDKIYFFIQLEYENQLICIKTMGCSVNAGKRAVNIGGNPENVVTITNASISKKAKKSKNDPLDRRVSSVNDLIVQQANFVMENENKFQEVYRIANVIGAGAFGEVRVCFHRDTGAKRAVKIFRKDMMTNESSKANLDREIAILKSLDHPNIVRVYEFFEDSKRLYIVMEYCSGGELFAEITKRASFTENQAAQVMHQLFSAVSYLHDNGILHRDLKPENILLEEKNELINIKLVDFGTATFNVDKRAITQTMGTAYYIAPEVIEGDYNEKCDVWSCGVIMYILLAGYPPFNGTNDDGIIESIRKGVYDLDGDPWPRISEDAKELLCLILTPEKKRLSASQALQHTWISQRVYRPVTSKEVMESIINKLKAFHATSKLRDAVHTFITLQCISNQDTKILREVFRTMDKNGDGKISRGELLDQFINTIGTANAEIESEHIMKEVDTDANGFIDYTEFLKATMDIKKVLSAENLKAAFKLFDRDGSGSISKNELKKVLGGTIVAEDHVWNEIIREADQNGDGEIDLQEFQDLILSKI
ncbi:unnamed protein product [Blepharisma stoltei]|uniref:non-specific serine/threonine protein kinase n=1 Tax=Blepharisma stoltei TaxID=1481888 RepID=A0AAU9IA88_9CILI|nr:unnamed protein product [Blepharisma stoltei]